ncbi:type I-F CRISPR-associated protein Csy2 [Marinobacterium jannaschii]|uniref:type I-F CRISPR-associated protein Csy2 n=1 Tax=Marinobacterium jannaschii TaxID=64970 RepID=UPI000487C986|nr:type I-F CRISPR-associated protein Csy2 [Marinobacterium jannaschii]
MTDPQHLLVLPRLRIQNANAISSPLTWGFPAMSAFTGFMQALERKVMHLGLMFEGIGVVCHQHQAQTSRGFVHQFHQTRNPVGKDGKTAAIVEEGRIHLEVTLILAVRGDACQEPDKYSRARTVAEVAEIAAGMRIAGGSVLPGEQRYQPELINIAGPEGDKAFRRLRRRCLPGFALVLRDDLLHSHHQSLQAEQPDTDLLDAWLDMNRLHHQYGPHQVTDANGKASEQIGWYSQRSPGWLVPIPVGYGGLSELHPAGTVSGTRDSTTPVCFVESLYSMGQWLSPHRLQSARQLLWYVDNNLYQQRYRLNNDYAPLAGNDA